MIPIRSSRCSLVWWILFFCVSASLKLPATYAKSPSLIPPKKQQQYLGRSVPNVSVVRGGEKSRIHVEKAWVSGIKNSLASALAAGCSKLILAPFDTIKTLQQHSRSSASANPLTMIQAAQVILQRPKGFLELYVS